jgi:hypothetical protein
MPLSLRTATRRRGKIRAAGPGTLRDANSRATKADYPHSESTSPKSRKILDGVPADEQAKIKDSTPLEYTISTWKADPPRLKSQPLWDQRGHHARR